MKPANTGKRIGPRLIAQRIHAALLLVVGASLCWLGGQLILLGGSPYYIIAGLMVVGSGALLWRRDRRGAWLYAAMLLGTYIWAFWEVGLDGWALAPRLIGPTILGLWLLTPWSRERDGSVRKPRLSTGAGAAVAAAVLVIVGGVIAQSSLLSSTPAVAAIGASLGAVGSDWLHYGNDQGGKRFSTLSQITPDNVRELKPAWSFRAGFLAERLPAGFETTPLKIGDTLYLCTPNNDVIALDSETGHVRWRFRARADKEGVGFANCRGVSYYRDAAGGNGLCAERIITATIDARLVAVDRHRGTPCPGFGNQGVVDLRAGFGPIEKGYYYVTSAPQIVRGKIVLGGWVPDNQHIDEPTGVIRAFDAKTGALAWAFDVGRPGEHGLPHAGQTYTKGTPNSWAPISADEALGLVYLPTGNSTPDWYGGQRRPFDEEYSSAVIALDVETGAVRWSFQTTHHDLWDYDIGSQPTLYDLPLGGKRVPALIQPTKRGEIFVLDRRTGKPLTRVEERPVPASTVAGERASPTQPFSTGIPSFVGPRLTEAMMWGLTPIDQAWCRVAFRQSNYQGTLTPPMVGKPTIVLPGYVGGSDWGGVSIDTDRDILVGNASRIAIRTTLIPRREADAKGIKPISSKSHDVDYAFAAQAGTPYALLIRPFISPLDVPCQQPPYGVISAIDMKTRKLLWERPFGTSKDSGPFGMPSMLPITMGVPNMGGSVVTRSGLTFIAATQDRYLRAYDTRTGRELWKARLPAGGQATPMTYMSRSGRQFVVIAAGGNPNLRNKIGDYVVAYALPR